MAIKLLKYTIRLLFSFLSIAIVCGTMFAAQHPGCYYNNFILLPNYFYYSISILLILFYIYRVKSYSVKNLYIKKFNFITTIIVFFILTVALSIALWIPADIQSDYLNIHSFAIDFPNTFNINSSLYKYFLIFPYNLHAGTLFGIFFRIFHSWRAIIIIEMLFTFTACILTALTVKNITRNKHLALIAFMISVCLLCFNLRAATPYTDCSAMLCHTTAFYIYTSRTRNKLQIPLIIILIALGTYLKVTSLIIIIAIVIVEFIYNYKKLYRPRKLLIIASYTIIFIILLRGLPVVTYKLCNFTPEPDKELRLSYFLYLGQNTETHGTVAHNNDWAYANSLKTAKSRDLTLFNGAYKRIVERGVVGNIKFIINKLIVSYRDGLLDHHERHLLPTDYKRTSNTLIGQIMLSKGRFFQFYAGIEQILWNSTLLLLLGNSLFIRKKNILTTAIIFTGSVAYILLFENRACYVYMFVPYIIILAMQTLKMLTLLRSYYITRLNTNIFNLKTLLNSQGSHI